MLYPQLPNLDPDPVPFLRFPDDYELKLLKLIDYLDYQF